MTAISEGPGFSELRVAAKDGSAGTRPSKREHISISEHVVTASIIHFCRSPMLAASATCGVRGWRCHRQPDRLAEPAMNSTDALEAELNYAGWLRPRAVLY